MANKPFGNTMANKPEERGGGFPPFLIRGGIAPPLFANNFLCLIIGR